MSIARIIAGISFLFVAGISFRFVGTTAVLAADGTAAPTPGATAAQTEPAAAKAEPTAGQPAPPADKAAIVGNWKSNDDTEVMEFAADGSLRVKDPNAMFMGSYTLSGDGNLHMEIPAFGAKKDFLYKYEIKGDELTLTLTDKKPRKYSRVK